jgi:hypothetical protein
MKTRDVVIFSGDEFTVPQGIQRIDTHNTHGWQVRYHGTKFFSDGTPDGTGAERSLERATRELLARIAKLPAPVSLKRGPSANKSSDLPPGISGPIQVRRADGSAEWAVLSVSIPRYGRDPRVKRIYIGSRYTYTKAKFKVALARAVDLRTEALAKYNEDATRAKRRAAREMRAAINAAKR